jgi:hypothetical protein
MNIRRTTVLSGAILILATSSAFSAKPVPPVQGDITSVAAGAGLQGGGTSGDVSLALKSCSAGQVLVWDGVSSWQCMTGGDVTAVDVGSGLTGGGNSGAVAVSLKNCQTGDVLVSTGTDWACEPAPTTPAPGGIQVYAAGQPIGRFLMMDHPNTVNPDTGDMWVLSSQGYLFNIKKATARFFERVILFENSDCTGTGYVGNAGWAATQGWVTRIANHSPSTYYIARGTQSALRNYASEWRNSLCNEVSGSQDLYALIANDPAVTGVPNEEFSTPLLIGTP